MKGRAALACFFGVVATTVATASPHTGHIAVWHHHHAVSKTVLLPAFSGNRYLSDGLLTVGPLPDRVEPDPDGCFCFAPNDERLAYVHTYYYAHQVLSDYDALLRELRLPPLHDVQINVLKDRTVPTTAVVAGRRKPHLEVTFPSPAVDPFTLAQALGQLIDLTVSPRHRRTPAEHPPTLRSEAEAAGVEAAVASILAALELGQTGSQPFTDDTLDAPPMNDVDTFVRFPDLIVSRRTVFKNLVSAPRFASRYGDLVRRMQKTLADPAMHDFLSQPDAYASAAAVTQPLWQAAVHYGFRPAKLLVLRTLAHWSSSEVTYQTLARELVAEADASGSRWASFLSDEYRRRGLSVPDARLDLRAR